MLFLVTITGWIMGLPNVSNWLKNWVPWCWNQPKALSSAEVAKNYLVNEGSKVYNQFFSASNSSASNTLHAAATASNGTATICDEFTGYLAVYRLMFATTVFFIVFGFVMIKVKSSRDPRVQLHNG